MGKKLPYSVLDRMPNREEDAGAPDVPTAAPLCFSPGLACPGAVILPREPHHPEPFGQPI